MLGQGVSAPGLGRLHDQRLVDMTAVYVRERAADDRAMAAECAWVRDHRLLKRVGQVEVVEGAVSDAVGSVAEVVHEWGLLPREVSGSVCPGGVGRGHLRDDAEVEEGRHVD